MITEITARLHVATTRQGGLKMGKRLRPVGDDRSRLANVFSLSLKL